MTSKLTKALEFSNYRLTLNIQQNALRSKVQTLLSYSTNGGTFEISQMLISFVQTLITQGHSKAVLLDVYNNPVEIVGLDDFLDEILSRYFEATNEYHAEYSKIKKSRKVHKLVDLELDDNSK
ncbi:hypothetical protein N8955_00340 [bacterium]|jgi:hypothetical protein|nr:hypothetical protein [bacterium]MDA9225087.1 hypothetical protein [bacterium]